MSEEAPALQNRKPNVEPSCLLSIVVTTFDRPDTLANCLDSIAAQSRLEEYDERFEVLVTRDRHSDEVTSEIDKLVSEFRERMPRTVLTLSDNQATGGQSSNTNNGISLANGKYIQVLHDDDALHPSFLTVVLPILDSCDDRLVVVDPIAWDGKRTFVMGIDSPPKVALIDPRFLAMNFLPVGTYVPSVSIFLNDPRADIFFDETLDFVCDWDFFARQLMWTHLQAGFVKHVRAGLVLYRSHGDGLSGSEHGALVHLAEHLVLIRKWKLELDFFTVMGLTPQEEKNFEDTFLSYRKSRLEHDLSKIRLIRLLSPTFGNLLDTALSRQVSRNPFLVADHEDVARRYRKWIFQFVASRVRLRVGIEFNKLGRKA